MSLIVHFRSGEKFEEPNLDECEMQFLYGGGDEYSFMDTTSYEQVIVFQKSIG